jgi:DNA-binding CsgD family transcriptional regulator
MGIQARIGNAKDGGYNLPVNIHITKRELEALILVSRGLNNNEAALKLGVNLNTFRNHVYNVMKKLGANNRAHALLIAIEKRMLEVAPEKIEVYGVEDYVLCWICHRAYAKDEIRMRKFEPIIIDHVKLQPPDEDVCFYDDCNASAHEDVISWNKVRESHPEYPTIPKKGVVYDTKEAPWYWIEREKEYELQKKWERKTQKKEKST